MGSRWPRRRVDVVLAEGLGDAGGVLADLDAAGRVAEDHALLLAEGEQRPQRDQEVGPACPVQAAQDGLDVVAGDLTQVVVTL
jgi:hypothetical protein